MQNNNRPQRRPNNMGGNPNGGQNRYNNNNRNNNNRKFSNNNNRPQGDDSANVSRTRRNATQSREKYQNLAREALSAGDRVLAENYLQHADHYYRVLAALPPEEVRQQHNNTQKNEQQTAQANEDVCSSETQENVSFEVATAPLPNENMLPAFITQPIPQAIIEENIN